MIAAGRRKLLWVLVIVLIFTGVPAGMVYATSTQEKLNQAEQDKKETCHKAPCIIMRETEK